MAETGRLIVLEGLDDAALGALAARLCDGLREQGLAAEHTREPTYGPAGVQVRLARQGRLPLDPISLALLYVADRLDHLERKDGIQAWLSSGRHVLCVHHVLYTHARQWGQVDWDWQRRIDAPCRAPDLTLYVDTPLSAPDETCEGDAGGPGANAGSLRVGYLQAIERLQAEGQAVVVVDGRGTAGDVYCECQRHVDDLLGRDDRAPTVRK